MLSLGTQLCGIYERLDIEDIAYFSSVCHDLHNLLTNIHLMHSLSIKFSLHIFTNKTTRLSAQTLKPLPFMTNYHMCHATIHSFWYMNNSEVFDMACRDLNLSMMKKCVKRGFV